MKFSDFGGFEQAKTPACVEDYDNIRGALGRIWWIAGDDEAQTRIITKFDNNPRLDPSIFETKDQLFGDELNRACREILPHLMPNPFNAGAELLAANTSPLICDVTPNQKPQPYVITALARMLDLLFSSTLDNYSIHSALADIGFKLSPETSRMIADYTYAGELPKVIHEGITTGFKMPLLIATCMALEWENQESTFGRCTRKPEVGAEPAKIQDLDANQTFLRRTLSLLQSGADISILNTLALAHNGFWVQYRTQHG